MDGVGDGPDGMGFDMPMMMNQQSHLYPAYGQDASPVPHALAAPGLNDDSALGTGEDQSDAKRRRIARVRLSVCLTSGAVADALVVGLRYVPEEEDQV